MRRGAHVAVSGLVLTALPLAVACGGTDPSAPTPTAASAATAAPGGGTTQAGGWVDASVDLDGVTVVVRCRGTASGDGATPTVLFVAGLAQDGTEAWLDSGVPDRISSTTRACVYDRPGLGDSDPTDEPRGIPDHAEELARIVEGAGIATPVVLVAQGFGTFIVRQYATPQMHRKDVAGMVLVDPPLWTLDTTVPEGVTDGQRAEHESVEELNAELGLYGAANVPLPPVPVVVLGADPTLPSRPGGAVATSPGTSPGTTVGTTGGTAPGTTAVPSPAGRRDSQNQLAQKSPFGDFLFVDGAGSEIQHWNPDAVVEAIVAVLEA